MRLRRESGLSWKVERQNPEKRMARTGPNADASEQAPQRVGHQSINRSVQIRQDNACGLAPKCAKELICRSN
jgi:hypothetical protein